MLDIVRVGAIASGRNALNEIIVAILLLYLIIANQHLGKHTSGIGAGLTIGIKRHLILLRFLALQISQETELVEGVVLVEIVELTRYLVAIGGNQGRTDIAISLQRKDNGLVGACSLRGIAHTDIQNLLGAHY